MRIFYAAGNRPNEALPGSSVWRVNLYLALVSLGHDMVELDFDLEPFYGFADPRTPGAAEFLAVNRPRLEGELLRQIRDAHVKKPIDLFFSYFYSAFVTTETLTAIANMGITTVNWYCNASYQFDLVKGIAPAYAYSLVPEAFRLDDYRAVGARPIYCQEAANPDFYHPYPVKRDIAVSFIGAGYGDRPWYIAALERRGVAVRVWGPGWLDLCRTLPFLVRLRRAGSQAKRRLLGRQPRPPLLSAGTCGSTLSDEEMVRTFSRSIISLGFSTVGNTGLTARPIRQVRLRDFEVPMSGGFYMLEYLPEIEDFFLPGREIVCFEGTEDLIEKVRYYLVHDAERERIRLAGYERALHDHTWQTRLSCALSRMNLS